jgi:PKD repeat protein
MLQKFTRKSLPAASGKRTPANVLLSLKCFAVALAMLGLANTAAAQTYCASTGTSNIYYIIDFTTTGGTTNISNTGTNYATNGYGDYTAMAVTAAQGSTFSVASTAYLFTYKWGIWIDWNQDGDFDDTGESVYSYVASTGLISITTTITVPAAATAGSKRMRVKVLRDWVTDPLSPCGSNYTETEDYTVIVTSSSCNGAPNAGTANAAATTVACNATTSLSLTGNTAGTGITYQWQYNTSGTWINFGTNAATQTTPPITQSTQFRCRVTCTNPGGSTTNSAPVTVGVIPIPVNIGNDTTICPGITYTLNAGNPGAAYSWNTGATTQSITVNTAGSYSVLVTNAQGCTGSDAINITPGVAPVNNLPAVTNLCFGETASLNAGNTGSTFLWTPGNATTQFINVTAGGIYSVKIRSVHGCVINSSTNVTIRPLPVPSLGNDTSICEGAQITLNAGNPGYSYLWNTSATTQTIPVTDSGTYSVTITTPYNCVLTEAKHVAYLPSPRVEGFNFIPLFYEHLGKVQFSPLNPTNVYSYEWNFGDGSPVSTQVNPMHVYSTAGAYEVSLKVYNGCGDYEVKLPINVDLTTGIVTLGKDAADVALYPNPSNAYITIENKSSDLRMEQIMVFNMLGAVVHHETNIHPDKYRLSVDRLAAGIYTARILTNRGFVVRRFEVVR